MKGNPNGIIDQGQLRISSKWGIISLERPGRGLKGKFKIQPGEQNRGDEKKGSGPEVI